MTQHVFEPGSPACNADPLTHSVMAELLTFVSYYSYKLYHHQPHKPWHPTTQNPTSVTRELNMKDFHRSLHLWSETSHLISTLRGGCICLESNSYLPEDYLGFCQDGILKLSFCMLWQSAENKKKKGEIFNIWHKRFSLSLLDFLNSSLLQLKHNFILFLFLNYQILLLWYGDMYSLTVNLKYFNIS